MNTYSLTPKIKKLSKSQYTPADHKFLIHIHITNSCFPQCYVFTFILQCQTLGKAIYIISHSFYGETAKHFHFNLLIYHFINNIRNNIQVLLLNYMSVYLQMSLVIKRTTSIYGITSSSLSV